MLHKRIWNFIVQLLLTPISLVINIMALTPIIGLFTGSFEEILNENISLIITLPLMFAILGLSFVFNRLLFRFKGKSTDETYLGEESLELINEVE